jgi:hypothetical protein
MTELSATRFDGMETAPSTTPGNPVLTYPPHPYAAIIAKLDGQSKGDLFWTRIHPVAVFLSNFVLSIVTRSENAS